MSEIIEMEQVSERASSLALITSDGNMQRVMSMAKMMAGSKVTVPKHLQGSEGDCAAIVIQATNWGMNPFAVAQKTHLVNGVLGYEAQLVNAVIQSSNAIKGNFSYEYQGDGNQLSCRVGATLNGQADIIWGEWLKSSDVTTKNSPLWETNPRQQMGYLQVKNWARLYCPGAILGVYTADEIEDMPTEKDITPSRQSASQAAQSARPTGAVIDHNQEQARSSLIEVLQAVASAEGLTEYGKAWLELSKQDRVLVGADEHQRLKSIAAQYDEMNKPVVVENPPQAQAGDDFLSGYEEAEKEAA